MPHHATLSCWCCPSALPRRAWLLHGGALPHGSWRQAKELPLVFSSPVRSKSYLFNSSAVLQQPVVFVPSTPLTPKNHCYPMEASWHRLNCVSCSGSHWAQAGCGEWCCLMFSSHLSQCIWEKPKVRSHVMMQIIHYIILSHLLCFFEDLAEVIEQSWQLMVCFPFNIVSF